MSDRGRPVQDIRGTPFPRHGNDTGVPLPSVVAVPRVRDVPNVVAQEVLYTAFLAMGPGTAFTQMALLDGTGPFIVTVSQYLRIRLNSLFLQCADMTAAVQSLVQFSLRLDGQPMPAWGLVWTFPEAGVMKLSLDVNVVLQPGQKLTAFSQNNDGVNNHTLWMYLYGWQYPADYVDGQG